MFTYSLVSKTPQTRSTTARKAATQFKIEHGSQIPFVKDRFFPGDQLSGQMRCTGGAMCTYNNLLNFREMEPTYE